MEFALVPALFLVGLASGAHCVGMCGGIVTAFSAPQPLLPAAALWRRLQPMAVRLRAHSFAAGLVWGLLPCGLVYGALATAAAAGSPASGAAAMASFGLGTLPWLLGAGAFALRLRAFRVVAGSLVLAFGAWGLARASGLPETLRQTILCL